jgi:hypothetical protein
MKRHFIPSGLLYFVGAVAFAACSTSKVGLEGPPGPTGPQGPQGPAGELPALDGGNEGGPVNGDIPPVSARAQRGLEISPVAISTAGLSSAKAEQLGQGSYLVNAVGSCPDCHTPPGPPGSAKYLAGGIAYAVDNGAVVYARNLTPDPTTGMTLTQEEFTTALTTGQDFTDKTGNSVLLVMAWSHFRWLTPDDLNAMYAYLKAIPAVVNQVPADTKQASTLNGPPAASPPATYDEGAVPRPLPPSVDALGQPISDPDGVMRGLAIRPLDAPSDATLKSLSAHDQAVLGRGSYLANAAQCSDCHTNPPRVELRPGKPNYMNVNTADYLTGGHVFLVPAALEASLKQVRTMSADLTGQNNGFLQQPEDTFGRFLATIESGTHADESVHGDPARALGWPMPWQDFRNMTMDDLEALYTYLKALPHLGGAADKDTSDYARYCQAATDCAAGEVCTANECAGASCGPDDDDAGEDGSLIDTSDVCNACQRCQSSRCAAPDAKDPCLTSGL